MKVFQSKKPKSSHGITGVNYVTYRRVPRHTVSRALYMQVPSVHRRNRTFKPSIGPMLGQYKRPDWASDNAITTGPLQARLQLGQYKRLLELAHIKWLDLAQVQQMRRAFFSTN